jgi:hypothetical protein
MRFTSDGHAQCAAVSTHRGLTSVPVQDSVSAATSATNGNDPAGTGVPRTIAAASAGRSAASKPTHKMTARAARTRRACPQVTVALAVTGDMGLLLSRALDCNGFVVLNGPTVRVAVPAVVRAGDTFSVSADTDLDRRRRGYLEQACGPDRRKASCPGRLSSAGQAGQRAGQLMKAT